MIKNKLGIIGGSGLYEIEGLKNLKWKTIKTPWGNPSDQILNFNYIFRIFKIKKILQIVFYNNLFLISIFFSGL
jgi:purine nucleoside phosphorylase